MGFKMSVDDNIVDITNSNFSDKIKYHDKIVSVFFYSPQCPHCKKVLPIYKKLAQNMDKVIFGQVNVLNQRELTLKQGISSVPTIRFYCDSNQLGEIMGEINETMLKNTIKDYQKYGKSCSKTTPIRELDGYA